MTSPCCTGGGPRRLARRLSGAAASLLPGALLVLLPKCPLCLAAWLTMVTGIGIPAAAAAHARALIVVFWVAVAAATAMHYAAKNSSPVPSRPAATLVREGRPAASGLHTVAPSGGDVHLRVQSGARPRREPEGIDVD